VGKLVEEGMIFIKKRFHRKDSIAHVTLILISFIILMRGITYRARIRNDRELSQFREKFKLLDCARSTVLFLGFNAGFNRRGFDRRN